MFGKVVFALFILIAVISGVWYTVTKRSTPESATSTTASFDKNKQSISEPSSTWMVVNKKRPLPATYEPTPLRAPATPLRLGNGFPEMQLREEAATAAELLVAEAKTAGHNLMLVSGYRSYSSQKIVYDSYVRQDGQAKADTYSARPGYSEHQTGLATDFGTIDRKCELEACFGDTPAGKWLVDNAPKYGYILRYGKDNQDKVGYEYEPWHFRFVGVELASEINKTNQTLEEFFSLPPADSY